MFKTQIFPVKRAEWALFGFMFLIVSLINVNFSILRSMRNTLVVADAGGSAAFIPYFELFGTFPASILLTWGLSRLMRVFSFRFTFTVTMFFFLTFFIVFAFWIYPHKEGIQLLLENKIGTLFGLTRFKVILTHWPDMTFYIMAELWKVALLSVIFWGFLNQNLTLTEAKRFYPPLFLGTSVGTILSGPLTVFCTSMFSWNHFPLSDLRWQHSLYMLTFCLVFCGLLTHLCFRSLFKRFQSRESSLKPPSQTFSSKLSLSSSLRYLIESPYLRSLLLIVVAEYVCYTLGELIFLETLKEKYPSPTEYCQYMGNLSFWMGILVAVGSIFITPYLLHAYNWTQTFLMPPILMVAATLAFFSVVCLSKYGFIAAGSALGVAVVLGSIHFCVGRAAKYTLFDTIKELAFIPLDQEGQVKGKLIIDGIGSRLGRGASSFLSILLFLFLGGPGESVFFAGILALTSALVMFPASKLVGTEFEKSQLAATPK